MKNCISKIIKPFEKLGFTNRLAMYILLFLAAGLAGGFILAWRSISYGYTGITFASAQANGFVQIDRGNEDSPAI